MPVVACPKCPAHLKIADGASGHVKCPKCGTLFPVTAPKPAAAFEVVDGTPAPAPAPKPVPAPAPPPKSTPAPADEDDFEVVDEKPKKKSRGRYDDEDDDEDDRPRSRRKHSRDYDNEDDDDRPRRRRKRRRDYDDYDEDDDWSAPRRKKSTGFGPARTGALLLGIGAWLYMGTFGLMALFVLIGWAGGGLPSGIMIIAGLMGLGNWVVSLVGLGFCLAGPPRTRGTALAATIVSAIHLILSFVCFLNLDDGVRGFGMGFGSSSAWVALASVLPAVDMALPLLIYQSGMFTGGFLVAFLAGGCEIARLILIIFTLKGQALAARDHGTAERSKSAVLAVAGVCGGVALAALLIAVLVVEGQLMRSGMHLASAAMLLSYLAYAFMTMAPALLARDVKDTLPNRA